MDDMNQMDESDRRLVEALKAGLAEGRYEVGTGSEEAAASAGPASSSPAVASGEASRAEEPEPGEKDDDLAGEATFLNALNAYRRAKKSGDREATLAAERHLQEVTRAELQEFEAAQGNDLSSGLPRQGGVPGGPATPGSCPMPPAV